MSHITPPSYTYSYIKIILLKGIIMNKNELRKLKEIKDFDEFIDSINPYYPDLIKKNYTAKEIEKVLNNTYLKLIGKILCHSPEGLSKFIKTLLLKYEIKNIKSIILGVIVEIDREDVIENLYLIAEEYLGKKDFIEELYRKANLDEIQLYLKKSIYYEIVREGINYFKRYNETFVLEAFLDQIYYKKLLLMKNLLKKKESKIILPYIDYSIEIYNLKIIYRGIKNKINPDLLKKLLIDNYLFLNKQKIDFLLKSDDPKQISSQFENILSKERKLKSTCRTFNFDINQPIKSIEQIYINFFLKAPKNIIDNIEALTIFRILELLIKKEYEIKNYVLPRAIRINQLKYSSINFL